MTVSNPKNVFLTSLISGGTAGTLVDVALFPLDTLKTRLQSQNGFLRSGGFNGLYRGITPVIVGSAPTAALFFVTYDSIKALLKPRVDEKHHVAIYMGGAAFGEMVACLIRVPVEVVKQRRQAFLPKKERFGIRILYRGYWSTVLRDLPFSLLQFPLWEYLKQIWKRKCGRELEPWEGAVCGAISGGVAAAATTPLDVAKTRIMLSRVEAGRSDLKISRMLVSIYRESGVQGLFAGFVPRVLWITLGGFIFFGIYEKTKVITDKFLPTSTESESTMLMTQSFQNNSILE
ncbi:S-adenosylmethionine mitochondrial carrier protein-like [Athalia rosae]|uniref:S-adenosylmethionine mitochondrial carrier protein-like n=1 Tax=Athalia rosae TaxID=37344 RepID=UPI002033EE9A|nr:S-adenosylmethionine mitochondrial carrier protein-like [Athalia rosae]